MTVLNQIEYEKYQQFLQSANTSLFYHDIKHLEFIKKLLKAEIEIFAEFDTDGNMIAAIPFVFKEGKYGKVYNSLAYYGSFGGLITNSKKKHEGFLNQTILTLERLSASYSVVSNPLTHIKYNIKNSFETKKNAQVNINLGKYKSNSEDLMTLFHASRRRNIRKAEKYNISFYATSDYEFIKRTHVSNMEAIDVTPKSDYFFCELEKSFEFGKNYKIYECCIDNEKVAALLLFFHNDIVEYYMPAIKSEFRSTQALSWLIFKAMEDAINAGYSIWNWGGTPLSNANLHSFKLKWGSVDMPYSIQTKVVNKGIFNSNPEELTLEYPNMFVAPFDVLNK